MAPTIAPAIVNWIAAPAIQPKRILNVSGWTAKEIKCGHAYTNPTRSPSIAPAPARPLETLASAKQSEKEGHDELTEGKPSKVVF
jgi:hypothetical protein